MSKYTKRHPSNGFFPSFFHIWSDVLLYCCWTMMKASSRRTTVTTTWTYFIFCSTAYLHLFFCQSMSTKIVQGDSPWGSSAKINEHSCAHICLKDIYEHRQTMDIYSIHNQNPSIYCMTINTHMYILHQKLALALNSNKSEAL